MCCDWKVVYRKAGNVKKTDILENLFPTPVTHQSVLKLDLNELKLYNNQ